MDKQVKKQQCKWLAFVSQTGSEVLNLSNHFPTLDLTIVTNNITKLRKEVWQAHDTIVLPRNPTVDDYLKLHMEDYDMVTLNGWLRIVPPQVTEKYSIVNGHPGLITKYPELKGKDPQKRAFEGHYLNVGAVVHKVTPQLDGGEILEESSVTLDEDKNYTMDDYYEILHKESEKCWIEYIKKRFPGIEYK